MTIATLKRKAPDGNRDPDNTPLKRRPPDGNRGPNNFGGWWITFEEAKERVEGKEPWFQKKNFDGVSVADVHDYMGDVALNKNKPVWLYENGDMYFGQWKENEEGGNPPLEEGFGVLYYECPPNCRGLICIGNWRAGLQEGACESYWLKESKIWKENYQEGGIMKLRKGSINTFPFQYRGSYKNGKLHDKNAIVSLKDGTTRRGPWRNGKPVRGWNSHSLLVRSHAESPNIAAASSSETTVSAANDSDKSTVGMVIAQESHQNAQPDASNDAVMPTNQEDASLSSNAATTNSTLIPVALFTKQEDAAAQDHDIVNHAQSEKEDDSTAPTQQGSNKADHDRNENSKESRDELIAEIRDWIIGDVIRVRSDPNVIEEYALKFHEEGFTSVETIIAYLNGDDVESFVWMPNFLKRIFKKHIKGGW